MSPLRFGWVGGQCAHIARPSTSRPSTPSFARIWECGDCARLLLAALRQEAGAIAVTPVIRGIMHPQVVAVSVHCVTDPRIKGTPSRCCYNKPQQLCRSRHSSLHQ